MSVPVRLAVATLLALSVIMKVHGGSQYSVPDNQRISQGREIWLNNCETCHGYGVADAPIPMEPEQWRFRLAKGKDVLYKHAIDGFIGPDYSMMPARGGNDALTDEEIMLAVDYMVFLASHYINELQTNNEVKYDSATNRTGQE